MQKYIKNGSDINPDKMEVLIEKEYRSRSLLSFAGGMCAHWAGGVSRYLFTNYVTDLIR